MQVDPVDGGTDNNYAYTNQPITEYDLDGKAIWIPIIMACVRFCRHIPKAAKWGNKVYKAVKSRWRGGEIIINKKKNFRVSPFGNRGAMKKGKPYKAARQPHWHYKSQKWGANKHRPWETTFRKRR